MDERVRWLTPGARGIGTASFFADVGHEVPTALLPGLVTRTLGGSAAVLGLIEGTSDALAAPHASPVARSPTTPSTGVARRSAATRPPRRFLDTGA